MRNNILKNYKKFINQKRKQSLLNRFFNYFLPEVIYRNTKIEHPESSKKDILSIIKS